MGENVAAECEDADQLDRGPTHWHRPHNAHTHTNITSHSMGTLLKISLRTRVPLVLHVGEAFCKHMSSDPVQKILVYIELLHAPQVNPLIRQLRKTFLTRSLACWQTENAWFPAKCSFLR